MSMNEQFGSALRLSEVQDFFNKDNIIKLKSLLTEQTDPPEQYSKLSDKVKTKWKASIKELYQYTSVSDATAAEIWDNEEGVPDYTQAKTSFWNKLNGINTTKAEDNEVINIQAVTDETNVFNGNKGKKDDEMGWENWGWKTWVILVIAVIIALGAAISFATKFFNAASKIGKAFKWILNKVGLGASWAKRGMKAFWGWLVRQKWNPIAKRNSDGIKQFFEQDIDELINTFKSKGSTSEFESAIAELLRLAKNPAVYTKTIKDGVPHLVNMFKAGVIDKHVIKQYVSPAMWNKMKPKINAFIKDTNAKLSAKNGKPSDYWVNSVKGKAVGL